MGPKEIAALASSVPEREELPLRCRVVKYQYIAVIISSIKAYGLIIDSPMLDAPYKS